MEANFDNENIKKTGSIGFNGIKKTGKNLKAQLKVKSVETSAQQALGFMGRAHVNMGTAFKGSVKEEKNQSIEEIKEECTSKLREKGFDETLVENFIKILDSDNEKRAQIQRKCMIELLNNNYRGYTIKSLMEKISSNEDIAEIQIACILDAKKELQENKDTLFDFSSMSKIISKFYDDPEVARSQSECVLNLIAKGMADYDIVKIMESQSEIPEVAKVQSECISDLLNSDIKMSGYAIREIMDGMKETQTKDVAKIQSECVLELLKSYEYIRIDDIVDIISSLGYNLKAAEIKKECLSKLINKEFDSSYIPRIIRNISYIPEIAERQKEYLFEIIDELNIKQKKPSFEISDNSSINISNITQFLRATANKNNLDFFEELLDKQIKFDTAVKIVSSISAQDEETAGIQRDLLRELSKYDKTYEKHLFLIACKLPKDKELLQEQKDFTFDKLLKTNKFSIDNVVEIIVNLSANKEIFDKEKNIITNLIPNNKFSGHDIARIIKNMSCDMATFEEQEKWMNKLLKNDKFSGCNIATVVEYLCYSKISGKKEAFFNKLSTNGRFSGETAANILFRLSDDSKEIKEQIKWIEELSENNFSGDNIARIISGGAYDDIIDDIELKRRYKDKLLGNDKFSQDDISKIVSTIKNDKRGKAAQSILDELFDNDKFSGENIAKIIIGINYDNNMISKQQDELGSLLKDERFSADDIATIFISLYNNEAIQFKNELIGELLSDENKDLGFSAADIAQVISEAYGKNSYIEDLDYGEENATNLTLYALAAILKENNIKVPEKYNAMVEELEKKKNGVEKSEENKDAIKLPEEDIEKVEKLLRKALKCPRQYLHNIPLCTTQKDPVSHKYKIESLPPSLDTEYKKRIVNFFANNIFIITKLYKYLDSDTINTMMDGRTDQFRDDLINLNKISDSNLELVKDMISGKNEYKTTINDKVIKRPFGGSGRKKLELCKKIQVLQALFGNDLRKNSEVSDVLNEMISTGKIDFDRIGEIINDEIYKKAGINREDLKQISNPLNSKYSHYIALSEEDDEEARDMFYEVIRTSSDGKFLEYISDENNVRGQINKKTEKEFKNAGLNFEAWNKHQIEHEFDFRDNQKMKLKLWDRNPMEDLFIGNKTSCCTAIGGCNGFATPIYLLNKCFNVIELLNDKGETVGMSRVFMANVENKPSLIIENIELNANYKEGKTTREEKEKIRDEIFQFAKDYAKKVNNGVETPVYFSKKYTNVPTGSLKEINANVDFIGSISENDNEEVYLNLMGNRVNPKMLKELVMELYCIE